MKDRVVSTENIRLKDFIGKRGIVLSYLVDSTNCLLPAGATAGLHHVADVFSGSQQLGHVHSGLWPQ